MDPLAHTLVGAALAETGLNRWTRYGTAALVVGANIPDIDVIAQIAGPDPALLVRRGVTHGVMAMAVLPLMLTGAILACHRWRGREHHAPAPHAGWLFLLATMGTLTHPALDWMNTYGVRLLSPFSDRWFYGDTLFIIDPWMWLATAAAVVPARSRTHAGLAAWIGLAGLASLLVLFAREDLPMVVKIGWFAGVAAIVGLRVHPPPPAAIRRIAIGVFAALVGYIGVMIAASRQTADRVSSELAQPTAIAAPRPGDPFARDVIVLAEAGPEPVWQIWRAGWPGRELTLVEEIPQRSSTSVSPEVRDAAIQRAVRDEAVRGAAHWLRAPAYRVEAVDGGLRVDIIDLRYARFDRAGFAAASVIVPD